MYDAHVHAWKMENARAFLRERNRFVFDKDCGVSWDPARVDVEETHRRELERLNPPKSKVRRVA